MVTRRKTHFWLEGDFEASDICIIRDSEKSTNPHTSPGKSTNNTPFCLALQTLTDEKDSYFLPNWIYSISSAGKASKSKAVYDSWQRALTDLNSELCEWTCLNGPLPCSWNMISREWKPFENFIFQRNTSSQRAAAWRHEAPSVAPDDETTCVLDSISPCIYLLLSKCLPVRLSDFSVFSHSAYQQENTWIPAATPEFNGLGMNLGTEKTLQQFKCFIIKRFYLNEVVLIAICLLLYLSLNVTVLVFLCWNNDVFE